MRYRVHKIDRRVSMAIILLLGTVLRYIGITWGNPVTFHPDEGKLMYGVLHMAREGKWSHSLWIYPNQATSKIVAIVFRLLGIGKGTETIYVKEIILYRCFFCFISVLSIWLTYEIGKRIRNEHFALLIAAMVSIYPGYVKFSKMIVGDSMVMFFSLLIMLIGIKYIDELKMSSIIIMSFLAACATLEKWNGAAICLFIAFLVIWFNRQNGRKLIIHGVTSLVSYFLSLFIMVPNLISEIGDMRNQSSYALNFHGGKSYPYITAYPILFFTYGGVVLLIVVIIGAYRVCTFHNRYHAIYIAVLIVAIAQWVVMTRASAERWGLYISWGMIALTAEGIYYLLTIEKLQIHKLGAVAVMIIAIAFVSEDIFIDVLTTHSGQDTRVAGEIVLKSIGANIDNTASDSYTPFFPGGFRDEGVTELITPESISDNGIRYYVIGGYYTQEHTDIKQSMTKVATMQSEIQDADLFYREGGHGAWNKPDCDSIRATLLETKQILKGALIGPSFEVYERKNCISR